LGYTVDEFLNGLRLVAFRLKFGDDFEIGHESRRP
jgi:hypothetical protein